MEEAVSQTDRNNDNSMFDEICKMNATLQVLAADVVSIKETTKELKDAVDNMQVSLGTRYIGH